MATVVPGPRLGVVASFGVPLAVLTAATVALPAVGFALLLGLPALDVEWSHNPSHFWLVIGAGSLGGAIAYATGEAARRRRDARVFLVSLSFLVTSGGLVVHALATPGVLRDGLSADFVLAPPMGLLAGALLAAASAWLPDGRPARRAMRVLPIVRWVVLVALATGAIVAAADVSGSAGVPAPDSAVLLATAGIGFTLYLVAVIGYLRLIRHRPSPLLLALAAALALLAEATLATAFADRWHLSWWEWHALILIAVGLVAAVAHRQWHEERFKDLYMDETAAAEREVSVLFADLAGFTRFCESNEPREVAAMLNGYFVRIVPSVVRIHEGSVDRIMGDAIMVVFNRHGDQPDHASRAVRAARDLQAAAADLASAHPGWPRFRVGVNTGPALVVVLGAEGGRTLSVIGDAVNVAARLEHLAPPGGVALGPGTVAAVEDEVTPIGAIEVTGRDAAVEVSLLRSR